MPSSAASSKSLKRDSGIQKSSSASKVSKKKTAKKATSKTSASGEQSISKYFSNSTMNALASGDTMDKIKKAASLPEVSHPEVSQGFSPSPKPEASNEKGLTITEIFGDLFKAPANALLIHACNCKGSWGGGIAAAFRVKYPAALKIYKAYCDKYGFSLLGKALLIPPQPTDPGQHYIGCLFTSRDISAKKDSPSVILNATGPAMSDLLSQARSHIARGQGVISEIRLCKINSVLFNVKWEDTVAVLETDVENHGFQSAVVYDRPPPRK